MTPASGRFLRDNAFLVAAVSLPLVVVAFFLLSTALPRWMVPPPTYDLLIRATDTYNQTNPRLMVDFDVRGGKAMVTFQALPANGFGLRAKLYLWDHATMSAREIPVEVPDNLVEGDPRTVVVTTLAGREVLAEPKAPDGYQLQSRSQSGPGLVGELFGMNRYDSQGVLVNKGRVIPLELPAPFQSAYASPVSAVGWLVPESHNGQR
jgi:hypothetical protein